MKKKLLEQNEILEMKSNKLASLSHQDKNLLSMLVVEQEDTGLTCNAHSEQQDVRLPSAVGRFTLL